MRCVQQGSALLPHLIEGLALGRAQAREPGAVLGRALRIEPRGSSLGGFEAWRAPLFGAVGGAAAGATGAGKLLHSMGRHRIIVLLLLRLLHTLLQRMPLWATGMVSIMLLLLLRLLRILVADGGRLFWPSM